MIYWELDLTFSLNIREYECFIPFRVLTALCSSLLFIMPIHLQFNMNRHLKELSLAYKKIRFYHFYCKIILLLTTGAFPLLFIRDFLWLLDSSTSMRGSIWRSLLLFYDFRLGCSRVIVKIDWNFGCCRGVWAVWEFLNWILILLMSCDDSWLINSKRILQVKLLLALVIISTTFMQ